MALRWATRGVAGQSVRVAARSLYADPIAQSYLRALPSDFISAPRFAGTPRHLARAYATEVAEDEGLPTDYVTTGPWLPAFANSVHVTGHIGKDPELRDVRTADGPTAVAKFSLAVKQDKAGNKPPLWLEVVSWGNLGISAHEVLRKGDLVMVKGKLRQDEWTDKMTGQPRSRVKVVAVGLKKIQGQEGEVTYDQEFQPQQPIASTYAPPYQPTYEPPPITTPPGYQQQQPPQQQQVYGGAPGGYGYQGVDQAAAGAGGYGEVLPQELTGAQVQGGPQGGSPMEELWVQYFANPSAFWDNRKKKADGTRKPNSPDFVEKDGERRALWIIDKKTPQWVYERLGQSEPPF